MPKPSPEEVLFYEAVTQIITNNISEPIDALNKALEKHKGPEFKEAYDLLKSEPEELTKLLADEASRISTLASKIGADWQQRSQSSSAHTSVESANSITPQSSVQQLRAKIEANIKKGGAKTVGPAR